jgi:hypothetical protein
MTMMLSPGANENLGVERGTTSSAISFGREPSTVHVGGAEQQRLPAPSSRHLEKELERTKPNARRLKVFEGRP